MSRICLGDVRDKAGIDLREGFTTREMVTRARESSRWCNESTKRWSGKVRVGGEGGAANLKVEGGGNALEDGGGVNTVKH